MNDQFTKPFTDLFKAGQNVQIPAQLQSLVQDGLSKTRDAAVTSLAILVTTVASAATLPVVLWLLR